MDIPQNPLTEGSVIGAPPEEKSGRLRESLWTIGILLLAPLMALFIISFVFRTYQVDGASMETTLHDQDRLIIYKVPKTISQVTGNPYVPERYDVIVLDHTGGPGNGGTRQLIKRVIGLPGERVVVKNGVVTLHNKEHPEGYLVDRFGPHAKVIGATSGNLDETVPKDQVFVMGDNRSNSSDSRDLGPIRAEDIVGKLSLRVYPFDKFEKF